MSGVALAKQSRRLWRLPEEWFISDCEKWTSEWLVVVIGCNGCYVAMWELAALVSRPESWAGAESRNPPEVSSISRSITAQELRLQHDQHIAVLAAALGRNDLLNAPFWTLAQDFKDDFNNSHRAKIINIGMLWHTPLHYMNLMIVKLSNVSNGNNSSMFWFQSRVISASATGLLFPTRAMTSAPRGLVSTRRNRATPMGVYHSTPETEETLSAHANPNVRVLHRKHWVDWNQLQIQLLGSMAHDGTCTAYAIRNCRVSSVASETIGSWRITSQHSCAAESTLKLMNAMEPFRFPCTSDEFCHV